MSYIVYHKTIFQLIISSYYTNLVKRIVEMEIYSFSLEELPKT